MTQNNIEKPLGAFDMENQFHTIDDLMTENPVAVLMDLRKAHQQGKTIESHFIQWLELMGLEIQDLENREIDIWKIKKERTKLSLMTKKFWIENFKIA